MNEALLLIAGAVLAVFGGAAGDEIRAWRERRRELAAIKISLADELGEIETTIESMHEVWEKTKIFHPSYLTDLLSMTSTFDSLRQRLFLIKDKGLRKRIVDFYKRLKDTAKSSEGKLGSLADTPEANAEQAGFEATFRKLGEEAKKLTTDLE